MSKELSNKINVIRIISMFSIVLCHILQYYNNKTAFWLNVGVQIFFLISGVLYGSRVIENFNYFWKSRFKKIILPYYIVLILFIVISLITNKLSFSWLDIFYYFSFSQAFNVTIPSLAHLWFMSYLLLMYLIIPILQKIDISKSKCFYYKLLGIILLLQLFQFLNIININITYLSIFISGYYFSRRYFLNKERDNYDKILYIFGVICIIGIPIQLFIEHRELPEFAVKFFIVYKDYIHAFLGISLFLIMVKFLPDIKNKFIIYISDISYPIYLIHQILIFGPFCLLNIKYGLCIFTILCLLLSISLSYITKVITKNNNL